MAQVEVAGSTIIEWSDLKQSFLKGYDTGEFPQYFRNRRGWMKGGNEGWNGCSADEMHGYLNNGFESPETAIGDAYIPKSDSRRIIFGEEGELDLALAWSGHDYPFLSWETQKRKPGIRMIAEFGFSGAISDKLIAEYGAWLLGILGGLETRGYDIELDIRFSTHAQNTSVSSIKFSGAPIFSTIIRVKRENELTDLSDFSALFSPGGYRMLMFLATGMAADKVNARLDGGIGRCVSKRTSVDFDTETSTLDIWADQMSSHYDFEAMTRMVEEALGEE